MARKTLRSRRQASSGSKAPISDQTLNTKRKTPSGSLVMVGKTLKVHRRSDHTVNSQQQPLVGSGPPLMVRNTPKLQVELPLHLLASLILTRLSVKTLSRFRCVSKPLCSLISEPHFLKEHARRGQQSPLLLIATPDTTIVRFSTYTIHGEQVLKDFSISFAQPKDHPALLMRPFQLLQPMLPFQLVQSCQGLVCLRTFSDGAILVFNPSTQEVITLPERPRQNRDLCVGFGYTVFSHEFKVVRFPTPQLDVATDCLAIPSSQCLSEVFTLGSSDGWRETRTRPPFTPDEFAHMPLVHGALHFLPSLFRHRNMRDHHFISAFDLHTEQYRGIPLPKFYFGFEARANVHQCVMTKLRGSLCLSFDFFLSKKLLQLWFLNDYHGGTWVKEYNIDLSFEPFLSKTFAMTDNDRVLLNIDSPEGYKLCYYNTKRNCIEKTLGTNCSAMFYVDSFLPLVSRK